jgi:hypothetical protein
LIRRIADFATGVLNDLMQIFMDFRVYILGTIGRLLPAAMARSTSSSFLFFSLISFISVRRATQGMKCYSLAPCKGGTTTRRNIHM